MPFEPGSRLGPYEILAELGRGGMGEVYRARDTRLERDVAIKILSESFGRDADRATRFEREAKSIAALSHPNVLAIFDTGRYDASASPSSLYVVTELLQGQTLRERLSAGALPVRKAVDCAVQIARGLAAAHDKGLVHRDLKPENVFLLSDGQVKILDFGLARPITSASSDDATQTIAAVTEAGTVMGTVGYMAPEQVRGLAVDGRCDVFALGAVLYEMLTGSRAFIRETHAETMTAILKDDPPDLLSANPDITPSLERIIRHCLEKNPAERFQSARDVAFALESLSASGAAPVKTGAVPAARASRTWKMVAVFAGVAAVAWAAGYFGTKRPSGAATSVVRLDVTLPEGDTFRQVNGMVNLSMPPGGDSLYYVAQRNGVVQVFRRRFESGVAEPVPGTEGAFSVFAEPNGEWLLFTGPSYELRRVPVSGGPSALIATASSAIIGITVTPEGHVLFGTHSAGLFRAVSGREPEQIVPVGDLGPPRFPVVLPGGKGLVFTVGGVPVSNRIVVLPAGQRTPKVLTTGTDAIYLDTDHLLFWRDGGLWAAPFDLETLTLGTAVPVVGNIAVRGNGGAGFAASANGTLAYIEALAPAERTVVWVDQKGMETPLGAKPGPYAQAWLSPDQRRVILAYRTDATEDLWMYDIGRRVTEPFVAEPASEWSAGWTLDSDRVLFTSRREGNFQLYAKRANGLGEIERMGNGELVSSIHGPTKDGMLFSGLRGLQLLNLTTQQPTVVFPDDAVSARISPNGKWLAYSAGSDTGPQVWVRPYPDVQADRWRVSNEVGTSPQWSPDGQTLYFQQRKAMMAAKVLPGATFSFSTPQVLFEGMYAREFDIAKDGRFLMIKEKVSGPSREQRIVVALNWLTEFKAKLGQR